LANNARASNERGDQIIRNQLYNIGEELKEGFTDNSD